MLWATFLLQKVRYVFNHFYAVRPGIYRNNAKLECGPMPNVMVALPNTGSALCSTPQSLADARYYTVSQKRVPP